MRKPHKDAISDTQSEARVSELCDEFAAETRRGASPSIERYLARAPELGHLLRPALMAVSSMLSLAPQHQLPQIGDRIGRFQIVRFIARGGMGVVYEAADTSRSQHVALKIMARPLDDDSVDQARAVRFQNEIRASASLEHSRIIPILESGEVDNLHYFVMSLVDGVNWSQWRTELHGRSSDQEETTVATTPTRQPVRKSIDWRLIATAIRDIGEALQHAHQRGLIHRDIKPSNLLRSRDGNVWIADFGLASFPTAASVTATGELVGTLRYMSPEQARHGLFGVDRRSDIYSLGATFYEMLTGVPLVDTHQRSEQFRVILAGKFASPRQVATGLPVPLETIVLKMLEHLPADRYQTASELCDDLDRWLRGQPIRAKRISWVQSIVRYGRARMGLVLATSTLLVMTTLILGTLVGQLLRTRTELSTRLVESSLAQAQSYVTSRRPGQRFNAIRSLREAASRLETAPDSVNLIPALKRTAATACSLRDVIVEYTIPREAGGSLDAPVFSRDLQLCSRYENNQLQILDTRSHQIKARIPMPKLPLTVCFSGDSAVILVLCEPESNPTLEAWKWESQERLWAVTAAQFSSVPPRRFATDVASSVPYVAVGLENGKVVVLDQATGESKQELQGSDAAVGQVKFSHDGRFLAVSHITSQTTIVWEWRTGTRIIEWKLPDDTFALAWSFDDQWLAVGFGFEIFVYRTDDWSHEPISHLQGPHEIIANLFFHPSNRWLAVYGYDGKTRMWDRETKSMILELDGHAHYFDPDGTKLAFRTFDSIGVWRLAFDDIVWHQKDDSPMELAVDAVAFLDNDRHLALAGNAGIQVWRLADRARKAMLAGANVTDLCPVSATNELLIACEHGLFRTSINELIALSSAGDMPHRYPWPDCRMVQVSTPDGERIQRVAASDDGKTIGISTMSGGIAYKYRDTTWNWLARPDGLYRYVDVSGDGQFIVGSHYNGEKTNVWRVRDGVELWTVDKARGEPVVLGEIDGKSYLLSSNASKYCWSRLDKQRVVDLFEIERPSGYQKSAAAVSDHGLLATALDRATVRITSARDGSEQAILIDSYQEDQAVRLQYDSNCRRLAVTLGIQGFAVWDLVQLNQEFVRLGLPPIDLAVDNHQ